MVFGISIAPSVMAGPNSSYSDHRGSADLVDIINDPKQDPHPQATLSKNRMIKISLLKLICLHLNCSKKSDGGWLHNYMNYDGEWFKNDKKEFIYLFRRYANRKFRKSLAHPEQPKLILQNLCFWLRSSDFWELRSLIRRKILISFIMYFPAKGGVANIFSNFNRLKKWLLKAKCFPKWAGQLICLCQFLALFLATTYICIDDP